MSKYHQPYFSFMFGDELIIFFFKIPMEDDKIFRIYSIHDGMPTSDHGGTWDREQQLWEICFYQIHK